MSQHACHNTSTPANRDSSEIKDSSMLRGSQAASCHFEPARILPITITSRNRSRPFLQWDLTQSVIASRRQVDVFFTLGEHRSQSKSTRPSEQQQPHHTSRPHPYQLIKEIMDEERKKKVSRRIKIDNNMNAQLKITVCCPRRFKGCIAESKETTV